MRYLEGEGLKVHLEEKSIEKNYIKEIGLKSTLSRKRGLKCVLRRN
jgi:hypothetical protein